MLIAQIVLYVDIEKKLKNTHVMLPLIRRGKYISTSGTNIFAEWFHCWMMLTMTFILWNAATIEKLENIWENKKSKNIYAKIF